MNTLKFVFGFLWAFPITFLSFVFYVLPFWLLGWYSFVGWRQLAWVWHLNQEKAPTWLNDRWKHWAGATVGNIIIMKPLPEESPYANVILTHELTHTKQCMILGIFQPLCYILNYVCGNVLKMTVGNVDGYYDNTLEIHARRAAGQIIDIVGVTNKISSGKKR